MVGVLVSLVKGLSKPRCSGMCMPGALQGETPKARSRAGGVALVPCVRGHGGPLLPGACVSPSICVTSPCTAQPGPRGSSHGMAKCWLAAAVRSHPWE